MNHIVIDEPNKCCGCKNCQNICPVNAISMNEDAEGFLYPNVDANKCINCGACKKHCPLLNDMKRNTFLKEPLCVAAKTKNKDIQLKCSSGGLFGTIALETIEKGGIVVGSEMDERHKVHHTIVDNKEALSKILGSKYVYSDLDNVFIDVKKYLDDDREVLFCGVPCQIAALINFLPKSYDNLTTVEVICHGTPSQKLFDKYVDFLEKKYSAKLKGFQFRSKKAANWGTFKALAEFEILKKNTSKIVSKKINADFDPYYWSFLNSKNYRESCYSCKYANPNRNADITLGDFWGIEHIKPNMVDYNGVSTVIINTNKGLETFKMLDEKIEWDYVDYKTMQDNNGQLKAPSKRPIDRDNWYKDIERSDFFEKIKIRKNYKSYIKLFFPQKLKFKIKKIISKK